MRIIETPWEKKNLNVNGIEFYFEQKDTLKELSDDILVDSIHDYQVVHLPVNKMDMYNKLNEYGFSFSETKFELVLNLKYLELPTVFSRFKKNLGYHKVIENCEKEKIFKAIKNGVFDTDKIALDPYFGIQRSGYRYEQWSRQIIDEGIAYPYMVTWEDNEIGFFILKKHTKKQGESFLAALFNKEIYSGLGFSVLYYPMLEAKKLGMTKIVTGVSSNNPDSIKLHLALGYQIKNLHYVMIKHLNL